MCEHCAPPGRLCIRFPVIRCVCTHKNASHLGEVDAACGRRRGLFHFLQKANQQPSQSRFACRDGGLPAVDNTACGVCSPKGEQKGWCEYLPCPQKNTKTLFVLFEEKGRGLERGRTRFSCKKSGFSPSPNLFPFPRKERTGFLCFFEGRVDIRTIPFALPWESKHRKRCCQRRASRRRGTRSVTERVVGWLFAENGITLSVCRKRHPPPPSGRHFCECKHSGSQGSGYTIFPVARNVRTNPMAPPWGSCRAKHD